MVSTGAGGEQLHGSQCGSAEDFVSKLNSKTQWVWKHIPTGQKELWSGLTSCCIHALCVILVHKRRDEVTMITTKSGKNYVTVYANEYFTSTAETHVYSLAKL